MTACDECGDQDRGNRRFSEHRSVGTDHDDVASTQSNAQAPSGRRLVHQRRSILNTWIRLVSRVAAAGVVAGCSGMGSTASSSSALPAAIAVPSGNSLAVTLKGSGLQNYECRAKADAAGSYDWAFIGPEAALRDKSDALVGRHSPGPQWEYGDGSKVTGKMVADVPAPKPGSIPWLLLKGTSSGTGGVLSGVTYVQRTNTEGGVAPSDACNASAVGTRKAVRYSADYLFYKG
jgi:hypothetical protein